MSNVTVLSDFRVEKIARLNDEFRLTCKGGRVVLTQGIASMRPDDQLLIVNKVRHFDDFSNDNDPWNEHDFGAFDYNGEKVFFKIDYYDPTFEMGSEDPANPEKTARVLTIMRADEY